MKKISLLIEKPQDVLNILELIKKEEYHHKERTVSGSGNVTQYMIEKFNQLSAGQWAMDLLKDRFDLARKDIFKGEGQKMPWGTWFLRTGAIILSLIEEWTKFDELVFANFLLVKHFRYKADPLLRWEEFGILIRMDSKLARLINVMEDTGLATEDEPPEKTAEDILGYCVLGYLLNKELKK